nr:MAG TPA: hypothetical protein [Caudoviricetes sp.]
MSEKQSTYRPHASRRVVIPDEVFRYVVDKLCDESNMKGAESICIEAIESYSVATTPKTLLVKLCRNDYYRSKKKLIAEARKKRMKAEEGGFKSSDCWLFWPTWKLIDKGYLVKG